MPDDLLLPTAAPSLAPSGAPPDARALLLAVVEHCRIRLARAFPRQVHAAVGALDDAQLWWTPHGGMNSVGVLVRHLAGNVRHVVGHTIGGSGYVRDRDAEFAAPPVSRDALLSEFDAAIDEADAVLAALTVERLAAPSADPSHYPTVLADVLNVTLHMSTHVGQMVWIAKQLREGASALDEIWKRSHREAGAYGGRA